MPFGGGGALHACALVDECGSPARWCRVFPA
jgi:hypothetical protein